MVNIDYKKIYDNVSCMFVESGDFKTNYITLNITTNLNRKTVTENALLPLVLKTSSSKYPKPMDLEKKLQTLYGASLSADAFKSGEKQILSFYISMPCSKYLPEDIDNEALQILLDAVFSPYIKNESFNEKYTMLQKSVLKEKIRSVINDKAQYALCSMIDLMFEGEPFSIRSDGYEEDLDSITPATLYSRYKALISAARFDLIFAGNFNKENMLTCVKKAFENRSGKAEPVNPEQKHIFTGVKRKEEKMDVVQGKLVLGFSTGISIRDKNYYDLVLANAVLGVGANCKLFRGVREKHSLCYYCSSSLLAQKGAMYIKSGIEPKDKQAALELILEQVEEVKSGNITDEEIYNSKKSYTNTLLELSDNLSSLGDYYFSNYLDGITMTVDEIISKINSVKKEDIIKAFANIKLDSEYFLTAK